MDLILTNGRLLTMGETEGWASALAISEGRIAAVGDDDEITAMADAGCRRINLGGRTLMPGFSDCHCHMLFLGQTLSQVDLSPEKAPDIASLVRRLQEGQPKSGWILGCRYDQNRLAEGRHPTRHDLDTVSTTRPIYVRQTSWHAGAVNSAALRLAGIGQNTPDPSGGIIERDRVTGEPTGVLMENALDLVNAVLPKTPPAKQAAALGQASKKLAAMGISSATEAVARLSDLEAFIKAADGGELSIRCHPFVYTQDIRQDGRFLTPEEVWEKTHPLVETGIAKIFADGASTTGTAYLREPYVNRPQSLGMPIWEQAELQSIVQGAHDAGWQIATHAIGDRAIDMCLDAYRAAQFRNPRYPARFRIEHAALLWDDQIGRMVSQDVIPVFQPEFISRFGDGYVASFGHRRSGRLMPCRSVVQTGYLPLVFSSDLPIVPGHPLDGVAAAVERKAPSGRILGTGERVTPYEGLRAYTYGAAYAAGREGERGLLAPGLWADLVVLSNDPTQLPVEEWHDGIRVELTAVAGDPVFGDWAAVEG